MKLLDLNGLTKYTELLNKMIDDKLSQFDVIPSGLICIWSGAVADIPEGWALCDGSNGTSDLRDKFIVGAGNSYSVNASGGSSSQNVSVSISSTTGATTISTSTMPSHTHNLRNYGRANSRNTCVGFPDGDADGNWTSGLSVENSNWNAAAAITNTGDGGSHTHSVSGSGSANVSILPPYYAKCYIQKL